jgi:integrase
MVRPGSSQTPQVAFGTLRSGVQIPPSRPEDWLVRGGYREGPRWFSFVSCQICAITVAKIWHVSRARRNHFGGVRKLPSGRYQARYWHAGAHHSAPMTFLAKADALAWLARTQTDIRRGAWVDPAGAQMTVAELATRWLEHDPSKRASTVARDEVILRLHILPQMGKRRVGDVTPPDLQRLVNEWAKRRAPRTARRQYDVVRALFAYAVASDWLARSPCRNIDLPRVETLRRPTVAPDDVAAIAEKIDARYSPMVWLGAVLGLRWGEVAGLSVANLDLLRGTLTVTEQLGRDRQLGPPKSAAGLRTLSLPKALATIIAAHLAANGLTAANGDRLIFTSPRGTALDYSRWRQRVWLPAVNAAGIAGTSFHDLRRANATALVLDGVDLKTAQARLGHSDPRLTLAVYAQATSQADRMAAERLGERFFGRVSD